MRAACQAQNCSPAHLGRWLDLSPIDVLISIKVGRRLHRQIPIRLDLRALRRLRMTKDIPQWGDMRGVALGVGLAWGRLWLDEPPSFAHINITDDMRQPPELVVDTNLLVAATRHRHGPSFTLK